MPSLKYRGAFPWTSLCMLVETICCTLNLTGSKFTRLNSEYPIWLRGAISTTNLMVLFWRICNLCFKLFSNRNFLFSNYFPKSIYRLMFVLVLTPGNDFFEEIFVSPHLISEDGELQIFLHDPNKIDSVWPNCKENLLSTSQLLKAQSSFPSVSWRTLTSFPKTNKAESSAYKMSLHFTADSMSLTYIRKSKWTQDGTLWYTGGYHPGFEKGTIYIYFLGSIR